ncbi:response regulator [Rhodobacterales bacterium]|nr:response regulator [Rhodobacterales bacterium]
MADRDDDSVKLALLAHDLRTPLSAMRLTAELIGQGDLNSKQRDQLDLLIRSIDALAEMTGELVRAAEPGTSSAVAPVRIADVVTECAALFQIAAEAKSLDYEIVVDPAVTEIMTCHGAALRRVVTTLLDNAVKYTASGGICVRVAPAGGAEGDGWVGVSVSDSGPGIDAEERARLFRPFVRGRHGRESGPGTGLGLWGTAELVREMGGVLELSEVEGGGSRFEVRLPAQGDATAVPVSPGAVTQRARAPAHGPLDAHVLIVDDNETNCRLLSALLESFGVTSEIVRSGEEALEVAAQRPFDAVLLDLHMPGLSGLETAEELRKLSGKAELPLVAVTAALDSVGPDALQEAGFQDVLSKPLSPAALYEILKRFAGGTPGAESGSKA